MVSHKLSEGVFDMRHRSSVRVLADVAICGIVGWCLSAGTALVGQSTTYRAPRSAYGDGRPDLNGVWQALNNAYWNVEDHQAGPGYSDGPSWMLGAVVAQPPGVGVVE